MRNLTATLCLILAVLLGSAGVSVSQELRPGEEAFWTDIKDTADPAELEAYLVQFPNGFFAALARLRLAALQKLTPQPQPIEALEARNQNRWPEASLAFGAPFKITDFRLRNKKFTEGRIKGMNQRRESYTLAGPSGMSDVQLYHFLWTDAQGMENHSWAEQLMRTGPKVAERVNVFFEEWGFQLNGGDFNLMGAAGVRFHFGFGVSDTGGYCGVFMGEKASGAGGTYYGLACTQSGPSKIQKETLENDFRSWISGIYVK